MHFEGHKGSAYRMILTSRSFAIVPWIAFGVIRMYCRPTDRRAAEICHL